MHAQRRGEWAPHHRKCTYEYSYSSRTRALVLDIFRRAFPAARAAGAESAPRAAEYPSPGDPPSICNPPLSLGPAPGAPPAPCQGAISTQLLKETMNHHNFNQQQDKLVAHYLTQQGRDKTIDKENQERKQRKKFIII